MDRMGDLLKLLEKNHEIMDNLAKQMSVSYSKHEHRVFHILEELNKNGKIRLKDLANIHEMPSASSLCVTLGQMEKEGLVVREIDAQDRRNTYYSISQKGQTHADEVMNLARKHFIKLFSPLSEEEIKTIQEAIAVVNEIFENRLLKQGDK
ncbi:MAG: MarR family winged helix-turn-helix transcriptional regulator [Helicobacteraceae bacterium]|jgi:DNA-binding MarR family transcriptional regulator|nr:MarR family winged helix-turn-helix transcriptional regulator [Helicobacteraceae bacterium]